MVIGNFGARFRKLILGVTLCQFKPPIPEATDLERLYWGLGREEGSEGNKRDFPKTLSEWYQREDACPHNLI